MLAMIHSTMILMTTRHSMNPSRSQLRFAPRQRSRPQRRPRLAKAACWRFSSALKSNLITSGLYFYLYNELSTITIKKTSATTMSVANTAKRVIVIIGVALALGESLPFMKLLGCSIGIGGVLLYSLVK